MTTTTFSVPDQQHLDNAIQSISSGGANAATSTAYTITLTAGFTLGSNPSAINLLSGSSVTIDGANFTIDGNNTYRGFFDYSGGLTLKNITIAHTVAQGGAGGTGFNGGGAGGGGAGLGGGLFVASGGQATLDGVTFLADKAIGGNAGGYASSPFDIFRGGGGGGGGLGSNGGNGNVAGGSSGGNTNIPGLSFDGGGGGAAANAPSSSSGAGGGGQFGGGGGGGGGGANSQLGPSAGGAGGFGAGGGGGGSSGTNSTPVADGGAAGFGGGGGARGETKQSGYSHAGYGASGGLAGFGGGSAAGATGGYIHAYAGGGLGAGAAVFVQQGGTLTITSSGSMSGGTVQGGSGSNNSKTADDGSAFGSGLFFQGNGSVTFSPSTGQTVTVSDTIADQTGSGGTGTNAGAGSITLNGAGTLLLSGSNTFTGGVTVNAGTLSISADANAGTGGTIALGDGTEFHATASFTLSHHVTVAGDPIFDVDSGNTLTITSIISDGASAGDVEKIGTGTLVLSGTSGANTYTGGTVIEGGTLELAKSGAAGTGAISFDAAFNSTLRVDDAAFSTVSHVHALTNQINGFIPGQVINLKDVDFDANWSAPPLSGNVLQIVENGETYQLHLDPLQSFANREFLVSQNTDGSSVVSVHIPGSVTTLHVSDTTTLNNALATIDQGPPATIYDIVFDSDITLSGQMGAINGPVGAVITIDGNGHTLSGGNSFRGFLIKTGQVTIDNLKIVNMTAQGGNGGNGGGGGAGLGGGLFVGATANVTLDTVNFTGDRAIGGNGGNSAVQANIGGGGGLGSNGSNLSGGVGGSGGGAGLSGLTNYGGVGTTGDGGAGGFGGGGAGAGSASHTGGKGGLGGGGGAGSYGHNGGDGGFGGGGGGGGGGYSSQGSGGNHGFGGGYGASGQVSSLVTGRGGGGAGLGGGIFVEYGGSLTFAGGNVSGGYVKGGLKGNGLGTGATDGQGFGTGVFMQGTATLTVSPHAGTTQTISDVIADQAASGSTGTVTVEVDGPGTLVLGAVNTFTGGVIVNEGTLSISSEANLGATTGKLTLNDGGGVKFATGFTLSSHQVKVSGDALFDVGSGLTATISSLISDGAAAGEVDKIGAGTLVLSNASNSYTGGTVIDGGTLELANPAAAGAANGHITFGTTGVTLKIDGATMPATITSGFVRGDVIDLANISFDASGTAQVIAGNKLQIVEHGVTFTLNLDTGENFTGQRFELLQDGGGSDVVYFTPTIKTVTATTVGGDTKLIPGDVVTITVHADDPVTATGSPLLDLNNGETATLFSGSGTTDLVFHYTVQSGDDIADLHTTGLDLNGGSLKNGDNVDLAGSVAAGFDLLVDTVAPALDITATPTTLGPGGSSAVTFTFSEAVTGFTSADAVAAGGTLTNFTHVSPNGNQDVYTATFTPNVTNSLAGSITVAAGSYADIAGNNGGADAINFNGDTLPPAVTITADKNSLEIGDTTLVTFTVSETGTDFAASDVTSTHGGLSNFQHVGPDGAGNDIYTAMFTPDLTDHVLGSVEVNANSFHDAANNANPIDSELQFDVDTIAPTVSISATPTTLGAHSTSTVTFTFDEDVSGFDLTDVTTSGGTLDDLVHTGPDGSGNDVYTATFTPNAADSFSGSVAVKDQSYTDVLGNAGAGSTTENFDGDTLAPRVTVSSDKSALLAGETATLTFTFSDAVTGFGPGSVVSPGGTISNVQEISSGPGQDVYTATFTPNLDDNLNAQISVAAGSYFDASNNGGDASDNTVTITGDTRAPTVTEQSFNFGFSFEVDLHFSEPVTDFTQDDLAVADGTVYFFQGLSSQDYEIGFFPITSDDVHASISIKAGEYEDAAGNIGGGIANVFTFDGDTQPPTVNISAPSLVLIGDTPTVTLTFSEPVPGFDFNTYVQALNGTLDNVVHVGVNGSNQDVYTATFTPDLIDHGTGSIVVAGGFADATGNAGNGTSVGFSLDTVAPTVVVGADSNTVNATPSTVQFGFSEPVADFDLTDVTVQGGVLSNLVDQGPENATINGLSGTYDLWTATLTPDPSSSLTGSVSVTGSFTDTDGNVGQALNVFSFSGDTEKPTVTLSADKSTLHVGDTATVTLAFSEPVTFDLGQFVFNGMLVLENHVGIVAGEDVYTLTFTPFAENNLSTSIEVPVAAFSDAAGNPGANDATIDFTGDTKAPEVAAIFATAGAPAVVPGHTLDVTFQFDEPVVDFTLNDATATGGQLSDLHHAGFDAGISRDTYTATFTPDPGATVADISVPNGGFTDVSGNQGVVSGLDLQVSVDGTPPQAAVSADKSVLVNGGTATVTFSFSEAVNFTLADAVVTGGTLQNLSHAGLDGFGHDIYTATFVPDADPDLSASAAVKPAYTDLAGNVGSASNEVDFSGDTFGPAVTITAPKTVLTAADIGVETVTFTFSAPVFGFTLNDLAAIDPIQGTFFNLTEVGLNASNQDVFTAGLFIEAANDLNIPISVRPGSYTDANGGPGGGGNTLVISGDTQRPHVAVTSSKTVFHVGDTATLTLDFDEQIAPLSLSDLTALGSIQNLTHVGLNGSGHDIYTATYVPPTFDNFTDRLGVSFSDLGGNGGFDNSTDLTINAMVPSVAITASKTTLAPGDTSTLTFAFNESVPGFTLSDATVTGGALSNLVLVGTDFFGRDTYSATFTPNAASGSVALAASSYVDSAGNVGGASNTVNFTVDTVAPTVTVSAFPTVLASGQTSSVQFTFGETVTGFDLTDIDVTGGTLTNLLNIGALSFATFTPNAANGSVSVHGGGYTDIVGNAGGGSNTVNFTYDPVAPTVAVSVSSQLLALGQTSTVTFTFSEAVRAFFSSSIDVTGGTLTNLFHVGLNGSNDIYTAKFTPNAASGSVAVHGASYTDLAFNAGGGSNTVNFTYDPVAPTVAVSASSALLGAGQTSTVTFTFGEAVTGFALGDTDVTGGALSNLVHVGSVGSNDVYTATFTPSAASGSVAVHGASYTDVAGNAGGGSNTANFTFDPVAPTATVSASSALLGSGQTSTVTFTFSEAVTGFALGDTDVAGGALSNLVHVGAVGSNDVYTATFTPSAADGSVAVHGASYTDVAGNAGGGSNTIDFTFDPTAPTVIVSASVDVLAPGQTSTVTFTFDKAVDGFSLSDTATTGGTLTDLAHVGSNGSDQDIFTATFTPDVTSHLNGSVTVTGGTYTDLEGNSGAGGNVVVFSGNTAGLGSVDAGPFGDFDGDGKADILWRDNDGQVAIWQMDGATPAATHFFGGVPNDWQIDGLGDFNHDGKADVLWQNTDGSLLLWLMDDSAHIGSTPGFGSVPANGVLWGIGDFDGDGTSDLLWRDTANGDVTISTTAGASSTFDTVLEWDVAGIGDLNGDGTDEVLFRRPSDGATAYWQMTGPSTVSTTFLDGTPSQWHVLAMGDFDGNGTSDIFWHNDNGGNEVWLMDTNGQRSQSVYLAGTDATWHVTGTGDFNADHIDDVVWRNDNGATALWQMNGTSAPTVTYPAGVGTDWATQTHHYDYV